MVLNFLVDLGAVLAYIFSTHTLVQSHPWCCTPWGTITTESTTCRVDSSTYNSRDENTFAGLKADLKTKRTTSKVRPNYCYPYTQWCSSLQYAYKYMYLLQPRVIQGSDVTSMQPVTSSISIITQWWAEQKRDLTLIDINIMRGSSTQFICVH